MLQRDFVDLSGKFLLCLCNHIYFMLIQLIRLLIIFQIGDVPAKFLTYAEVVEMFNRVDDKNHFLLVAENKAGVNN